MNSNLFKDLWFKVFRSGNPVYLYIGINTIIFVGFALLNLPFFLSGNGMDFRSMIAEYAGFPSALEKVPVRFYTLLTYQFFHSDLFHILFNMLWLFWLGQIFMSFLKPRQFYFVYLAGGFAGAILFLNAYNLFPVFSDRVGIPIIGSSAAVMAIIVATATLVPDYTIRLLFFGNVKLKYLALAYIVLDLIGFTSSTNAGGSFAHIGGAILGFTYIKLLQNGTDLSNILKKRPKLKVVKNNEPRPKAKSKNSAPDQKEIDEILDKISKTGYDNLSREEKEILFKASKD